MDLKLDGKRALVTGSSAGIGEGVTKVLAREGAAVVVHGRHEERANAVAEGIRAEGGRAEVVLGNLSTDEGAQTVAEGALSALGGIDVLVNNAGSYPWHTWFDGPAQEWADTFNTDVVSAVRLIKALVPQMVFRGWGRVINLSSASGHHVPNNNAPMYATTKAAMTHMGRTLAVELSGTGVTVNSVAPAPVATETTIELFRPSAEGAGYGSDRAAVEAWFRDNVQNEPPVGRMATVEEVASLTAYLTSPLADSATGGEYLIDCGFSLTGFRRAASEIPAADGVAARATTGGMAS